MKKYITIKLLILWSLVAFKLEAWQDDVNLFLRDPLKGFINKPGFALLPSAQGELRLGRYLHGHKNQGFRGGAMGDVVLFAFGPKLNWHWGLNMETLVDDNNDINFRLVQVYYQNITGLLWHVGPGVLSLAYSHRCSHGADSAVLSRILIRSGLLSYYELPLKYKNIDFLLRASLDAYVIGQNDDLANQQRGQGQLNAQMRWPIKGPWGMALNISAGEELISRSSNWIYFLGTKAEHFRLRALYGARLSLNLSGEKLETDFGISFSHIPDSGFGKTARAHSGLTFDIDFKW